MPPHRLPHDEEQMVEDEIAEMAVKVILKKKADPKRVFPFFGAKRNALSG